MTGADLHIHSTASDGQLSPREIVKMAQQKELKLIALTDHDTTEGLDEALAAGKEFSVQVIPGIEMSTEFNNEEVHILGYYIQYDNPQLQTILNELKQARICRIKAITLRLQDMGFDISWKEVAQAASGASSIGRPHVARVMVEKGFAQTIGQVFSCWIGQGCPAYIKRYKLTPGRAVEIIHSVGGLAFLAHPGLLQKGIEVAKELIPFGLDGIEVFHSEHSREQSDLLLKLALAEGLYVSGGSDCHGNPGDIMMGRTTVDVSLLNSWLKD